MAGSGSSSVGRARSRTPPPAVPTAQCSDSGPAALTSSSDARPPLHHPLVRELLAENERMLSVLAVVRAKAAAHDHLRWAHLLACEGERRARVVAQEGEARCSLALAGHQRLSAEFARACASVAAEAAGRGSTDCLLREVSLNNTPVVTAGRKRLRPAGALDDCSQATESTVRLSLHSPGDITTGARKSFYVLGTGSTPGSLTKEHNRID